MQDTIGCVAHNFVQKNARKILLAIRTNEGPRTRFYDYLQRELFFLILDLVGTLKMIASCF